jgi:hypothetical protein
LGNTCELLLTEEDLRQLKYRVRKLTQISGKVGDHFISHIPLPWILKACDLPRTALKTALAVQYVAGLRKSQTVTLSKEKLELFGLSRTTKWRGLNCLEKANLVGLKRDNKRNTSIKILKVK